MPNIYTYQYFFKKHFIAIEKNSKGTCIWKDNNYSSKEMISFKKYVLNKWIPFPSQNQIIESVIKDTALCATTRRSEKTSFNYGSTTLKDGA